MGAIEDAIQVAELIDSRVLRGSEAVERAQEAARELRSTIAAAEDARKALEATEARVAVITEESVRKRIEEEVSKQLEIIGKETDASMRKSVDKVTAEFDRLKNILMGNEEGQKPITEMIDEVERALKLKWPVFMNAVHAARVTMLGCSDQDCNKPARWAVLAMLDIPDGRRGEGHFHLCTRHKELMKQDPTATILKSFELETRMCPYQHGVEYMHETPEL